MKKVVEQKDIYESVKVGVVEVESWQTSDGKSFTSEKDAEYHEFYNCVLKMRHANLTSDIVILDFNDVVDFEKYEKDYLSRFDKTNYVKSDLKFPATYAIYETTEQGEDFGLDDSWYDYTTSIFVYTLDNWKKLVMKQIKEIK